MSAHGPDGGAAGGVGAIVDVLVPAYNAAATIEDAIGSIQRQSLDAIRIVVVDDGSTDGTAVILARIAEADGRVVVVTTPNRGIVDALNEGLKSCTAEFVARHDADDRAFADRLAVQVDFLRMHPEVAAVGGNAWHIDESGVRTGYATDFGGDVTGDPFRVPSIEPYLMHPFLTVRREALVAVGGYRYAFHSEDTDLYWRLLHRGRLHNLPQVMGEYRIHAGSVSSRSVVNGRISAMHSQLAALSEVRRRERRDDLRFEKSRLRTFEQARTMKAMLDIAVMDLPPHDRDYLRIATSCKLLELSSYRPYALDRDDLAEIRSNLAKHAHLMSAANRRQVVFREILFKRIRKRRYAELRRVLPVRLFLRASLELVGFGLRKLLRRRP